jgi:LysM repeat protein
MQVRICIFCHQIGRQISSIISQNPLQFAWAGVPPWTGLTPARRLCSLLLAFLSLKGAMKARKTIEYYPAFVYCRPMTCRLSCLREIMLLALVVLLPGCGPVGLSQSDEQKEPHFLAGKSRFSTMDYEGAIECFEKALQVNPQSASAHLELGCLYDQKENDPAAAIYHYSHYLKLCPNAGNADLIKQHILTCKQELASTVSLAPVTEKFQHEFEQLTVDNKRLTEENKKLQDDLAQWTAYARSLQALTNRSYTTPVSSRVAQSADPAGPGASGLDTSSPYTGNHPTATTVAPGHTHTVKPGETPTLIARMYGIKLGVLMAANPGLNPKRLHVGQALSIPTP